ncbi:hypothetical protein PROFUN_02550 [Planoprotostelium fungivorum]|uniref:DnaJ homologue subfamily C member 28 conserved domain-containing protein n=1 Tax=Planoprotostelium fungivorum TaxID=1890364 RepID=A0A2P6MPA7_9EUKA|nr:hypothetical protein PROFUN_02550 [Planoprotostelium fungivorum]
MIETGDSESGYDPYVYGNWLAESRIKQAISEGKFDDAATGKPLESLTEYENPFLDRIEVHAHKLMKRNGARPEWVEKNAEICEKLAQQRQLLYEGFRRRHRVIRQTERPDGGFLSRWLQGTTATPSSSLESREEEWKRVQEEFARELQAINKTIHSYNAMVPMHIQFSVLHLEREMERLEERRIDSK